MEEPECEWKAAAFSQYPRRKVGTGADLDGRPPGGEDRGVMSYTIRARDYRYRYTEWLRRATGEVKARDSTTIARTPVRTSTRSRANCFGKPWVSLRACCGGGGG